MSGNKYLLRKIVMEYAGESFMSGEELPRRAAVLVDWLVWLRSRFYIPKGLAHATHDNGALLLTIVNLITSLYRKTDRVFLVCDDDNNLPITKGHTQAARSAAAAAVLPEHELRLPSNADLVPAHHQAMHKLACRASQDTETKSRYSITNDEPISKTWAKLGLDPAELPTLNEHQRLCRIVDASFSHHIPDPWESAIESRAGNRSRTLPWIVMALAFSSRAYSPPPTAMLVIDGHYCKAEHLEGAGFLEHRPSCHSTLRDWPLVFTHAVSEDEFIVSSRAQTMIIENERPAVDVVCNVAHHASRPIHVNFYNSLGEADHKIFADLDRLYSALPPDAPWNSNCYEIVSTDVDLFLHAIWYLTQKCYLGPTPLDYETLPRIIINDKKGSEDQYCDMRALFTKLDQKLNGAEPDPIARARRLLSYIVVAFAFDSDYTIGFCYIVADTMFTSFFENADYIGDLVTIDRSPEAYPHLSVVLNEDAYIKLVLACYYRKYSSNLSRGGIVRITDLSVERVAEVMSEVPGKKYLQHMDNPTMDLKTFKTMQTMLSKRLPSLEQLFARYSLLQYYIIMVSQIGLPRMILPDPLTAGFELVDPSKPCARNNIRFIASNDYDNLADLRKELILSHLAKTTPKPLPSC